MQSLTISFFPKHPPTHPPFPSLNFEGLTGTRSSERAVEFFSKHLFTFFQMFVASYEAHHEVRLYSCRYAKLYVVQICMGCPGDA
jgi:hypothetical protein